MTLKIRIASLILAALAAGSASASPVVADPARGKQLYYEHGCYGCHGYNGQTGARNLVGTSSPIIANPQAYLFFLRQRGGFAPMTPSLVMPRFSEKALPDAQAMDIYAYIKTFVLDAPEPKTVPVMRQIEASAETLYTSGR
jgi:mono/diheme cytochrome c family protein